MTTNFVGVKESDLDYQTLGEGHGQREDYGSDSGSGLEDQVDVSQKKDQNSEELARLKTQIESDIRRERLQ